MQKHEKFMRKAIQLSINNMERGGGPFGAIIVKDDKIIAEAGNSVTLDPDPTAHAEINAIRLAAKELNNFDLEGCTIYSSCEPCPMCLGAIYWSKIDALYYGNTKEDAAAIQFNDAFIYKELDLPLEKRKLQSKHILGEEAIIAFNKWDDSLDKINY
jgi:tRNA(Arg) A34 adenosine deaminase TadA